MRNLLMRLFERVQSENAYVYPCLINKINISLFLCLFLFHASNLIIRHFFFSFTKFISELFNEIWIRDAACSSVKSRVERE